MKTSEDKKTLERKLVCVIDAVAQRGADTAAQLSPNYFKAVAKGPDTARGPKLGKFDLLVVYDGGTLIDDLVREMHYQGMVVPLLAYGTEVDPRRIVSAIRHGAYDYVVPLPDPTLNERALLACAAGKIELDHALKMDNIRANISLLTPRQKQIAQALARGDSHNEIAEQLNISHRTVQVHSQRLYKVLGAKGRYDLFSIRRLLDGEVQRQTSRMGSA